MIHREWIKEIRNTAPRIHCITNYVTAGDVANMILAVGGSPIMAQGIREVEDVTTICQGLVLNMGTLEEERVDAMILAGKRAASLGHPIILDPCTVRKYLVPPPFGPLPTLFLRNDVNASKLHLRYSIFVAYKNSKT